MSEFGQQKNSSGAFEHDHSPSPNSSPQRKKPKHSSDTTNNNNNNNHVLSSNMAGRNNSNMNGNSDSDGIEVDESLYSRQLYVLGHEAMRRMATSSVLISGLGGLGVEVAKNVILSGVKSVVLHDKQKASFSDLSSQFYLSESDIGRNRAEACSSKLAELNAYVNVTHSSCDLSAEYLSTFQVVVVCNDINLKELFAIGDICHQAGVKFIVGSTRGLFGQLFCDLGSSFTVIDADGEEPLSVLVDSITRDKEGVVTVSEGSHATLASGDFVTFSGVKGMTELNNCVPHQLKTIGPHVFSIGDTSSFGEYHGGGVMTQVKQPRPMAFKPMRQSILEPEYVISDFAKMDRQAILHHAFACLSGFVEINGHMPKPRNAEDAAKFVALCKERLTDKNQQLDEKVLAEFAMEAVGEICPVNAVIGGIAAQEVMKAISGKFTPVLQWFYFDALECLPAELPDEKACAPRGCRYDSELAVFGEDFVRKLASLKVFLVGAGAIGCELLKNWAMMGVGCSQNGHVIVTDMDTIETSNLNRQFLFRRHDIQKPKSDVAAAAVRAMNPAMKIDAQRNRVGVETEQAYNDEFFERLDMVVNALDNVDARLYMDRRCVYYRKPLLESGTLGTKGNVQVVVPDLTESYSSSQDPPEKSFPICTIKNFPNLIEHTLHWAREKFEGLFTTPFQVAASYAEDPDFMTKMLKGHATQALETLQTLKRVLIDDRPKNFDDCLTWGRLMWQEEFHNQIEQLIYNFPADSKTTEGQPFWAGAKRCPHSLKFDKNNAKHIDFVMAAANLRAFNYGITQVRDRQAILDNLARLPPIPKFQPRSGVKIAVTDAEQEQLSGGQGGQVDERSIRDMITSLPPPESLKSGSNGSTCHGGCVRPVDFEKDDDTNFHMDFIVAASNSRAENYEIAPADRHRSKLIAGRIIPAIATTTSVVVGLVCLELFKLVQGHRKLEQYKNAFLNMALPFFAFSEPIAPPRHKYNGKEWTLWDRFVIEGEPTLSQLIDIFKNEHGLEITMLSAGVSLLYSFFMAADKRKARLAMKIPDVIKDVSGGQPLAPWIRAIVLELCCNDTEGEDVEVPFIQYKISSKK